MLLHFLASRVHFYSFSSSVSPTRQVPKYDAELDMSRVSLRFSKSQYRDLLRALDFLGNHERIIRYSQARPKPWHGLGQRFRPCRGL